MPRSARVAQAAESSDEEEEPFPDENALPGYPTAHDSGVRYRSPFSRKISPTRHPYGEVPRTALELKLIGVIGALRDRHEWWTKAFDETIVAKWREEATAQGIEPAMFELALEEVCWHAKTHGSRRAKPAAADGVYCLADLPPEVKERMMLAVQRIRRRKPVGLQRSPRGTVDVHPGSDGLVIDLVHPSLYAYEEGASPVMPGGDAEAAPPWNSFIGTAVAKPEPIPEPKGFGWRPPRRRMAWLPAEFQVSPNGKSCVINSYISGLHPVGDADVYAAIGECFCHAVPALESVLTELGLCPSPGESPTNQRPLRVRVYNGQSGTWYRNWDEIEEFFRDNGPGEPDGPTQFPEFEWSGEEDTDEYNAAHDEWVTEYNAAEAELNSGREEAQTVMLEKFKEAELVLPTLPPTFVPPPPPKQPIALRLRPLQVITKIASIELTPEKPKYEGGTWHVEGMPDERIVATACVYLDAQNVTESTLQFRTPIAQPQIIEWNTNARPDCVSASEADPAGPIPTPHSWGTLQSDEEGVRKVLGFEPGAGLVQPRGTSRTLPGRTLAWPNTLHHCVSPFELADPTQPGHRTIVCFFLVDPTVRVRSSATVPPQAREWYEKEVRGVLLQTPLKALELRELVVSFLGDLSGLITYAEAADRRLRLMKERTATKKVSPTKLRVPEFEVERISFCEH